MGYNPQTTTITDIYGIGPANLIYGNYELGATQGGVTVEITQETYKQVIDAYGSCPIRLYEMATAITVNANLKEETLVKLSRIAPCSTYNTTTLTFGRVVGRVIANPELVVQPYDDNFYDIVIYSAAIELNWNLVYSNEGERTYTAKFYGIIDDTRTDGDKLFRFDDAYTPSSSSSSHSSSSSSSTSS